MWTRSLREFHVREALGKPRVLSAVGYPGVVPAKGGSRIENEVDVRLSTLERYVEALGGRLEIHAVFDDEAVKLS